MSQVALGPLSLEVHSQLWGPATNNNSKETDWTKTLTRVRQRIHLSACTNRGEGLPWRSQVSEFGAVCPRRRNFDVKSLVYKRVLRREVSTSPCVHRRRSAHFTLPSLHIHRHLFSLSLSPRSLLPPSPLSSSYCST